jgi:hypothetical protein
VPRANRRSPLFEVSRDSISKVLPLLAAMSFSTKAWIAFLSVDAPAFGGITTPSSVYSAATPAASPALYAFSHRSLVSV